MQLIFKSIIVNIALFYSNVNYSKKMKGVLMFKSIIILFVFSAVCLADTVWNFPFAELGAEWETGNSWEMDATGGHYGSIKADGKGFSYSLFSGSGMIFPVGIDSITVEFMSGYEYAGGVMDGWSYISILANADTGASPYIFLSVEDGISSMGSGSYEGSDTTLISETFPILEGEVLNLTFTSGVDSGGDIYWLDLYWVLWDMVITGHGDTSLSRTTWADIKNSFNR